MKTKLTNKRRESMIYSIDYISMAEKINHFTFTRYLKDTGWNLFPRKNKDIQVYQYKIDEEIHQVTIPMNKNLIDYKEAMYKAVKTVARVENKSIERVMLYLLNLNTD